MAFNFGGAQSSAAQASPGFSFGSAPPATGGVFGASSLSFGASQPQSTPGFSNAFAQPTATPQFGASSAAQGLFGASSSAFSFGTSGMFGAASQAASAPSLFGGGTPGFGGFGSSQAASQFALSTAFSTAQSQLSPAGFSAGVPMQPDYSALKELEAIAAAYNPANPKFRFNTLFLNVVDNPAARVKPSDVDELQWRAALQLAGGPNNPDRLWPVQAKGFKDLIARKNAQEAALKEHTSRLESAEHVSRQLARRHETVLSERILSVRRKHLELSHRLLQSMRYVDALEGRFAASQQLWDSQSQEVAAQLTSLLSSLEASVAPASAGGLQRQVEALATAAKLRQGAPMSHEEVPQLGEESMASMYGVLQQQADAIARLQEVLKRFKRDLALLDSGGTK